MRLCHTDANTQTGESTFGGISFDATEAAAENMELNQFLEENTVGYEEIRPVLRKAMLFAAYLSSEKPDVAENETQKNHYHPSAKPKNTSIRKWDVGIRYRKTVMSQGPKKDTAESGVHSRHSGFVMRPHIRKAHWHTYRIGKGRKETKVLWIPPIEINCQMDEKLPVVVHVKDKKKKEKNHEK